MTLSAVLARLSVLENPYPGLRAFDVDDHYRFFGRERQIAELATLLERHRFIAVVGVSGSGKSSLVRAGLIPTLKRSQLAGARSRWRVVIAEPGSQPFARLAAALGGGITSATLSESSGALTKVAEQLGDEESLLIVIDQFEELFRYREVAASSPEALKRQRAASAEAAEFVQLLLNAASGYPPVYVVITMRSDYLGDCAEFRDLPEALNRAQYLVPRLTRQERKEAIENPLRDVKIQPALVQQMLNDVGDEPEQLPVLQHALRRTWDQWRQSDPDRHRPIEIRDYTDIGSFQDALNRHADALLKTLPESIVERIFRRLTARGRSYRERRDPTTLANLWEICGADTDEKRAEVTRTVERLMEPDATFLKPRSRPLQPGSDIDITHESLIRLWKKLRDDWLPAEQASAKTFVELAERAANWKERGGVELRGLDLSDAVKWRAARNPAPAWADLYASRDTLRTVDEFISASELAEKKRRRQASRNVQLAIAAAVIFFGISIVAVIFKRSADKARDTADIARDAAYAASVQAQNALKIAETQRHEADAHRERAEKLRESESNALKAELQAREDAAGARDELLRFRRTTLGSQLMGQAHQARFDDDPELAILLAAESVSRQPTPVSERSLRTLSHLLPKRIGAVLHDDWVMAIAYSPDGEWTASGGDDHKARLYRIASNTVTQTLDHGGPVTALAFDPASRRLVTASEDGLARMFDVQRGTKLWERNLRLSAERQGSVLAIAFSPDSRLIAAGTENDRAVLLEADTGVVRFELAHEDWVRAVAFAMGGRQLVTASDDSTARLYDTATGKEIRRFAHDDYVVAVAVSRDDKLIATGSEDGFARVFEADTGKEIVKIDHGDYVDAVALSPDGGLLATGSQDGTARVIDVKSNSELWKGRHDDYVRSVAFSPDGRLVVSGSDDGTARVFAAASGREVTRYVHDDYVRQVIFSPDGRYVLTGSDDHQSVIFDASNETTRIAMDGPVFADYVSTDGRWLAIGGEKKVAVFDLATRSQRSSIEVSGLVVQLRITRDARWIVHGRTDGIQIFDGRTNRLSSVIDEQDRTGLAVSDNDLVITVRDGKSVKLFNLASGKQVTAVPHEEAVYAIAISDDSLWMATVTRPARSTARGETARGEMARGETSTVRVFNLKGGQAVMSASIKLADVLAIALSEDGRFLAAVAATQTFVHETRSGAEVGRVDVGHPLFGARFSRDGRQLSGSSTDLWRVFDWSTNQEILSFRAPDDYLVVGLFSTTDHHIVASASESKPYELILAPQIRGTQRLIEEACARVSRSLTKEEWKQYVGPAVAYEPACRPSTARSARHP